MTATAQLRLSSVWALSAGSNILRVAFSMRSLGN
jgi:hypothetical protein